MRQKYPHLSAGAWSSCGPSHAQVDFQRYKEVMEKSLLEVGGKECHALLGNAFKEMERLVEVNDIKRLKNAFNLCQPLDLTKDVAHFFYEISDLVATLIQGHRPGQIESACGFMQRKKEEGLDDADALGAWVMHGQKECLDMSYANFVTKFRKVEWEEEANRQMRQWSFQTCSEFGWFQTSTSKNQIFGSLYPLDYFIQICKDLYDFP